VRQRHGTSKVAPKLNTNTKLKTGMEKGLYHGDQNELEKHENNREAAADEVNEFAALQLQ
jgi:hypothetical protein